MLISIRALRLFAGFSFVAMLLTGCATQRLIDSEVQSFNGKAPALAGASYRLEQLPSQASDASRATLENMAHAALSRAGLNRSENDPRYTIQIAAGIEQSVREVFITERRRWLWRDPFYPFGAGTLLTTEPSRFRHTVRFVMRDRRDGDIVYETSASYEGGWAEGERLFPVLMQAALDGYPNPPAGPRTIAIPLSADGKS